MKNLLLILLTTLFSVNLFADNTFMITAEETGHCVSDYWYETCHNGKTYQAGKDVYVRVKAKKSYDIQWMDLYINGYKVRREMHAPYEWGRPNGGGDHYLRKLKKGTYKLKCVVKTKCGYIYKKYCTIYVKGYDPYYCEENAWFIYGKHGTYYHKYSDVYVKVKAQKHQDIEYMDLYVNNKKVRREMHAPYEWGRPNGGGDHYLRNMHPGTYQLKCKVKTKCGKYYTYYSTIYVKNQSGGS